MNESESVKPENLPFEEDYGVEKIIRIGDYVYAEEPVLTLVNRINSITQKDIEQHIKEVSNYLEVPIWI